ncbi:MAG: hypothetical protein ABH845_02505 [Candidatus Omnitrophota bacterium]
MPRRKALLPFPSTKKMSLGTWSLTPNHDLRLTLQRRKAKPFSETFTFTGTLLSAGPYELVFAARTQKGEGLEEVRLLRLKGIWRANDRNQLVFCVEKGTRGELTLEGAWELGKRHQILYRYQKENPDTGAKTEELLSFRGVWEIREKDYLTYRLDLSGNSRFDFRACLQSPSLVGKKGEIRYQLGIQLGGKDRVVRELVLFGKWKFSREASLSFEVEYEEGKRHAIQFKHVFRVNEQDEIVFALKNRKASPLGIEVSFTRSFFEGQGKAMLRFYRDALESRLEVGVRVPF